MKSYCQRLLTDVHFYATKFNYYWTIQYASIISVKWTGAEIQYNARERSNFFGLEYNIFRIGSNACTRLFMDTPENRLRDVHRNSNVRAFQFPLDETIHTMKINYFKNV